MSDARSCEPISRLAGARKPRFEFTFARRDPFSGRRGSTRSAWRCQTHRRNDRAARRVDKPAKQNGLPDEESRYFRRSQLRFSIPFDLSSRPIPAQSLNLQMQPGASIERTPERREGATRGRFGSEGKPAPVGLDGLGGVPA